MNIWFVVALVALFFLIGCGVGHATAHADRGNSDKPEINSRGFEKLAKHQYYMHNTQNAFNQNQKYN